MSYYKIKKDIISSDSKTAFKELFLLKKSLNGIEDCESLKEVRDTITKKISVIRKKINSPSKVRLALSKGGFIREQEISSTDSTLAALKSMKKDMNEEIKRVREHFRKKETIAKSKGKYSTTLIGGVYEEPKQIVRLFKIKLLGKLKEYKKPSTGENHLGVELEFISSRPRQDIELDLLDLGLDNYVTTKEDGSIGDCKSGERGLEIAFIAPESKFKELLKILTDYLNSPKVKARVNKTCGLHVHLDMRNRKSSIVFHNLVKCQEYLMNMLPNSRRSNTYCKKVDTGSDINFAQKDRYRAINVSSIEKHGTIEIRAHTGTTQYDKIINWTTILKKIADRKDPIDRIPESISNMCSVFELDEDIKNYVEVRTKKFNVTTEEEDEHKTA